VKPVVLDAAMGTALIGAGLPPGALPEAWLVDRPEAIAAVHAAHAAAGAELVLSCTFNLAAPRLRASGVVASIEELARRAVALARRGAPGARVAGAVGPTLLDGAPEPELRERYGEAFRALAAAGAELLWAESQWDLAEARAALAAARAAGLPAVVTFGFREQAGALAAASGEPARACLLSVAREGAAAVGANCALPGAPLATLLVDCRGEVEVPLVAKPSAGLPGQLVTPAAFAGWLAELRRAGASWVGGCCGATAEHLAAAARVLRPR
jgi:5-methyltetrahydrofolate--homocysteine methyltransferase